MDIKSLLTEYFTNTYNVNTRDCTIEMVDALSLFVPERIDLIAKYKYIEEREKGRDVQWVREVYSSHIEAFSLGKYTELGNDVKISIEAYFNAFDELIDDIKVNGYNKDISIVPVGRNSVILDGAHRTAIAAYFNIPLPIVRFEEHYVDFGWYFFSSRLLNPKYLDYIAIENCKLRNDIYMILFWPNGVTAISRQGAVSVDDIISEKTSIVYVRSLNISYKGLANLMTQVYGNEEWLGSARDGYAGARTKALQCYGKSEKLLIYLVESKQKEAVAEIKQQIRDMLNIDRSSVHSTDNTAQTYTLCQVLLNENSMHFIRNGNPTLFPDSIEKFDMFQTAMQKSDLDADEFIIDSSGVMGIYGLRDIEDVDFLSSSEEYNKIENDVIRNHFDYLTLYGTSLDQLLYNPGNYLVFNGLKFTTLEIVKQMKLKRAEYKDKMDVKLISDFLSSTGRNSAFRYYISRKANLILRNIMMGGLTIKILKSTGTYEIVRWFYRKLFKKTTRRSVSS